MIENASSPEIRRELEKQLAILNKAAGPVMDVAKLVQNAVEAIKASEFNKARDLLEEALSKLEPDWMGLNNRTTILKLLAEVQVSLGQQVLADSLYQQSITVGEELGQFNDLISSAAVQQSCFAYAKFLSTLKRYDESEKQFLKSLEFARKFEEASQKRHPLAKSRPMAASVMEELAKLLRLTNRLSEAEEVEEQVAEMNRQIEKRENELANDRRNYHEMVTELPPPPAPPSESE